MQLKEIIDKINKQTYKSPIFYITYNAERAVGIEDLLENFFILDGSNSYTSHIMESRAVNIHIFENEPNTTIHLMKNPAVQSFIQKHSHNEPYVMFFKTARALEKLSSRYHILNAPANLSFKIENKVSQYEILRSGGFEENLPIAITQRITEATYDDLSEIIGNSFIAQFDLGFAGNSTYFIEDKKAFEIFKEEHFKTNIMMKFAQQLDNRYITINGVATKYGTYVSALCNQITGLREIEAHPGETCGNNWTQMDIDQVIRTKAVVLTEQIGTYLYSIGYRGFFGVDFSITNEKLYILEINARQTTSIQNFAKLQLEMGQIPSPLIHIMECMGMEYDIDRDIYNELNNLPVDASTLVIRNHTKVPITGIDALNGLYNIEDLKKEEDAYAFSDVYSKSKVLILQAEPGQTISPHSEYLRIAAKGNVMKDLQHIDDHTVNIIKTATSYMKEAHNG